MSNMGYCRFQNTLADLRDCYDAMQEDGALSEEEAKARLKLIKRCCIIADQYGEELEEDK